MKDNSLNSFGLLIAYAAMLPLLTGCVNGDITFAVTSDAPNKPGDSQKLRRHLEYFNRNYDDAEFLVALGDLKSKEKECEEHEYADSASIYSGVSVPFYAVPGDWDWGRCRKPDQALQYWKKHFIPQSPHVRRDSDRNEHFAFKKSGVLFVGLNVIGGSSTYVDPQEWSTRHQDALTWVRENVQTTDPRALVVFFHAYPTDEYHRDVLLGLALLQREYDLPILIIHGDRDSLAFQQRGDLFLLQCGSGAEKPPTQVRVTPDGKFVINENPVLNKVPDQVVQTARRLVFVSKARTYSN